MGHSLLCNNHLTCLEELSIHIPDGPHVEAFLISHDVYFSEGATGSRMLIALPLIDQQIRVGKTLSVAQRPGLQSGALGGADLVRVALSCFFAAHVGHEQMVLSSSICEGWTVSSQPSNAPAFHSVRASAFHTVAQ